MTIPAAAGRISVMPSPPHPNDLSEDLLGWAMARSPWPDILDALVRLSRARFGWFTRHLPRAFEYPWILAQFPFRWGKRVLDIGAGVSPLPLQLAATGARVLTVDSSPLVRQPGRDQQQWNEWGYLDYAALDPRIESHNCDVLQLDLPAGSLDAIYSVSVIEHMPAAIRRGILRAAAEWLKPGGLLLLTVDLVPGQSQLWNLSEGQVVEPAERHGDLAAMEGELGEA
ncbi:MAG: class I SAM-dependent methyltransferase, partial [Thermoguttaceae bacterium]